MDLLQEEILSALRAFRNGAFYGTKIRAPHALVMVFLFQRKSVRENLRTIVRMTYEHTKNLAVFVGIYKSALVLLRQYHRMCGHKLTTTHLNPELPWHAVAAGGVAGYFVWSKYSGVNYQIVMYLLSRVLIALVKLASDQGVIVFKSYNFNEVYPVLACVTWGIVMWLFEFHVEHLHSSLKKSMDFLYHDCNTVQNGLSDYLPSPATVAICLLTWTGF